MARTIGIGTQSFETMREKNNFYVDKTAFIKEWWENQDDVTLITRPRRFGKTLNMDMIKCFFSNKYDDRGDLFDGLDIWKDGKYRGLQGTYPVIFLSFAGIKGNTFEVTRQQICIKISDLYEENRYLLDGDILSENEKKFYENVNMDMSDAVCSMALNKMCIFMHKYYGNKSIFRACDNDRYYENKIFNVCEVCKANF